jgi:hypothetical protein
MLQERADIWTLPSPETGTTDILMHQMKDYIHWELLVMFEYE